MEITEEQYQQVAHLFPVQRGNVKRSNLPALNAFLYLAEQGCKWRGLPERYGPWHTIYMRWQRWNQQGALPGFLPGCRKSGYGRSSRPTC